MKRPARWIRKVKQSSKKNLKSIAKGRTVLIVSHRLSTLTGCDKIVVMERGQVEHIGNHRALLDQSKVYQELWYQQMGQR